MSSSSITEHYDWMDEGVAAAYDIITDEVEKGGISTDRVPHSAHIDALDCVLGRNGLDIEEFRGMSQDQVESLLTYYNHDTQRLAENYLDAVKEIDRSATGRLEHDRKIDALIQHYLEDSIENYDLILKEAPVRDQDHVPYEEMEEYDELDLSRMGTAMLSRERPSTDADFMAVDLDEGKLVFSEVKTSEDYEQRKERQERSIKSSVKKANAAAGTDFGVEFDNAHHNLTYTSNPVPKPYDGDIHKSEDIREKQGELEDFKIFANEFFYDLKYGDLRPMATVNTDYPSFDFSDLVRSPH